MPSWHESSRYEGFLEVEVIQPLIWEDWDKTLGERMQREVRQTKQILMGGAVIMLWLADEIRVTHLGRRITMQFSPEIRPPREVVP
jgi:hypothetical protein